MSCYPGSDIYVAFLDALCLNSMKYMILDWNWRDQKLRRMVDIPEVLYKHLYMLYSVYSLLLLVVLRSCSVRFSFCKAVFSGKGAQRTSYWLSLYSQVSKLSPEREFFLCCCKSQMWLLWLCCRFPLFMLNECSTCPQEVPSVGGLCTES